MPKFLANIDLQKNQLLNAAIQNLASAPSSPVEGQIYHNTSDHKSYIYNGSSWLEITSITRLKGSSGSTASFVAGDINLVGGTNTTVTQVGSTFTIDVEMASTSIAFTGDVNDVSSSTGVTTTLTLKNTGVSAGTYGSTTAVGVFTVNAKGLITSATSLYIAGATLNGDVVAAYVTPGNSTSLTLANTAVSAGSYGSSTAIPNFTVDSKGRLTAASTSSIAGITLSGDIATVYVAPGGSAAVTLSNSGVTAGTYKSVTVDAKGRVTSGTNPTTLAGYGITDAIDTSATGQTKAGSLAVTGGVIADVTGNASSADTLHTARTIAVSGDATGSVSFDGSAGVTISTTLANTGVSAGSYGSGTAVPVITVDSKGRITGATLASIASSLNISSDSGSGVVSLLTDTFKVAGGTGISTEVTASGSTDIITVKLNDTAVSAGSYGSSTQAVSISVDAQGRLTSASSVALAGFTLAGGDINTVGGSLGGTSTISLTNTGVVAGTYNNVQVDAKGRVITAGNVAYLTSYTETDTLNSVTGRGATTSSAITINNTTNSTGSTNGALIVAGGIGVAKDGYIGGELFVGGTLHIGGSLITTGVSTLIVDDSIIYLANNNTGNSVDIGIVGHFNPGSSYQHTGFVRHAADGYWYLFSGVTYEPGATINLDNATIDTVKANILGNVTGNLTGLASKASNVDGGATGSLVYQTGVSTTGFVAAGTSGAFLKSQGTAAPIWGSVSKSDVGLGNVENTALSTWAGTTYITNIGVISSPSFTGTPLAPTASSGTNTTQIATTAFVQAAVSNGCSQLSTKYAATIGASTGTAFAVAHNLGSRDVNVTVREDASPYAIVYPDVEMTDANTVTIRFGFAPSTTSYRVIVAG